MESKLISVQEANKMLPLIKSIANSIVETWAALIPVRTELETLQQQNAKEDVVRSKKEEVNAVIDRINNYIREVEDLGCFVQEFKRGIIAFPSLFHGRKIFLCWAVGDEAVNQWHELDETYADRQKVQGPWFLEQPAPRVIGPAKTTF